MENVDRTYLEKLAARRRAANRLKARKKSLESGKGCLLCPASVLCLSGIDVNIFRCNRCGSKTVETTSGASVFVGSDIECWAVTGVGSSCEACRREQS